MNTIYNIAKLIPSDNCHLSLNGGSLSTAKRWVKFSNQHRAYRIRFNARSFLFQDIPDSSHLFDVDDQKRLDALIQPSEVR